MTTMPTGVLTEPRHPYPRCECGDQADFEHRETPMALDLATHELTRGEPVCSYRCFDCQLVFYAAHGWLLGYLAHIDGRINDEREKALALRSDPASLSYVA